MQLFGLVSGLAFAGPAIGGRLVSRWLGEQRGILAGGIGIAFEADRQSLIVTVGVDFARKAAA